MGASPAGPSPPFSSVLRPRPGRRLPRELRARHVGARARQLPGGLADPGFADLLRRIDGGGPIHHGNRVELFFDGDRALAAMLAAIREAAGEVLVEAYIFDDDDTGSAFLEALATAVARGVTARVLADAFGSLMTRRAFWRRMKARGIEVRLFHALLPHLWWQPFRDHRKIVVVDRRTAFTGGMNIADEYGSPRPRKAGRPWRDTHVRLDGPAAWEMAAVFSEGWERAGGRSLDPSPGPAAPAGEVDTLVLESRPGRGHRETAAALAAILGAARHSAWLTNAYFAPGRTAVAVIAETARRGVDVRLLLPGTTDVPLVRHAGHGSYAELLAHGVRIFEFAPGVLHAKSLVADRRVSLVGSTNLDFRSFRFNAECNLVLLDEATGATLAERFETDLRSSVEIDRQEWLHRPLLHRLADGVARRLSPLL